jgi:hypothetical protein
MMPVASGVSPEMATGTELGGIEGIAVILIFGIIAVVITWAVLKIENWQEKTWMEENKR